MSFPASHKTVFVLDHTLTASSGVKLEIDSFSKSRSGNSNNQPQSQPMNLIPLLPVTKSLWTCAVEAITEYCRIVWDIFPGSRLIRFIAVDKTVHKLSSWNLEDQCLTSLMNAFMALGPAKNIGGNKLDLIKGVKAAIEALTKPSAVQHEKRTSLTENATKVLNKGRIILVTKLDSEEEVKNIKEKFHGTLLYMNKNAAATDNLMAINHCDLVILNLWPEGPPCPMPIKSWPDVSTIVSCEYTNIQCGTALAPKLCNLVLKHYDLASTTVTGIPMKEEQNASSSANYDVELFHPAAAHAAILKGIPSETAHLKTYREGTDYETVTLKWCTPRSNASMELQHCSSAYRITSVDVNSRPSSCLTNFLLNGRWVMLEMPRKSGSKVISHMLACHGGDIYIHTMYTSRSILEDPPSISEGCGGRVTDYRIPDFGELIKANKLAPFPAPTSESEENLTPLERSREQLNRHTKYWPITLSSTSLFNLGPQIEPLAALMLEDNLTDDEVVECKQVILYLMNMEARGDPLPSPMAGQRGKGMKREDQYRAVWAELEQYLQLHLHTPAHEKVLECLMECHNKAATPEYKGDEKVDIDQALKELDDCNYVADRDKAEFGSGGGGKHTAGDLSLPDSKRRRTVPPPLAPMSRSSGMNLLTLWENKVSSEESRRCLEFQGRVKSEDNVTKLYVNLQKDKDKDEVPRKK
ncbi:integrator complex subunit 13-like [Penaeus chinensis]|uniref:integrator complex subunit 13-like n=1 Tax=Penaeus chinensis TaxID=139456 RepID=UPI001FB5F8FC|nr:integrator complex subunit 13-like [Penaeus chinensis]